jgi:hypothetical protein
MTTNLDIIKRAMKKLHVLSSRAEPSEGQAFDGLAQLKCLVFELIGQGSLGRLNDVLATSDYTAREFDRVSYPTGVTITLPTSLSASNDTWDYGFTDIDYNANLCGNWTGNDRPPLDRTPIVKINSTTGIATYYVWCAYKAAWVDITTITEQSDFPFAVYLEDGFAALLAERWVDDWDQTLGNETKRQANLCRFMLSQRPDSASRNTSSSSQYM